MANFGYVSREKVINFPTFRNAGLITCSLFVYSLLHLRLRFDISSVIVNMETFGTRYKVASKHSLLLFLCLLFNKIFLFLFLYHVWPPFRDTGFRYGDRSWPFLSTVRQYEFVKKSVCGWFCDHFRPSHTQMDAGTFDCGLHQNRWSEILVDSLSSRNPNGTNKVPLVPKSSERKTILW